MPVLNSAGRVTRLVIDQNMTEAVLLPFAGGELALFSARSPDKTTANEDAAGIFPLDDAGGVLVVADGMGGKPAGASASETVLRCIDDAVRRLGHGGSARGAILDAVEQANQALMDRGLGAATTLAALELSERGLRPYHVGDSSILVVGQRGKIKLQTVAHSPIGYAVEAGLLDENEALHHDERHLISNMIGATDMRIEVGSHLELSPWDTAVMASDGLFDNLSIDEIVETARRGPLEPVARRLVELGLGRMTTPRQGQPSKPDDCTFVLFRPSRRRTPAVKH